MISKEDKHRKHAKLKKVAYGIHARHELAVHGAPCEVIADFANILIEKYGDQFRMGYMDADHRSFKEDTTPLTILKGATKGILFKQTVEEVVSRTGNAFDKHIKNDDLDVLLINGNHFKADIQIVIADERKRDSLERHADRLTNVHAVFLPQGVDNVPGWLVRIIPSGQNYSVLKNEEQLLMWFGSYLRTIRPVLKGLVLTGGKSTRMGEDKSSMNYHGVPQYEYMADMIRPFCQEVFLSVRSDQNIDSKYVKITDRFLDLGPYSGILSAFMTDPEAAWLVIAIDLPLLNIKEVQHLIQNRNSGKVATAFLNSDTGFPDPLCTVWEPRAYQRLLNFLSMGHSCPRKVLINSEIALINPLHQESLRNVNTQDERTEVLKQLQEISK